MFAKRAQVTTKLRNLAAAASRVAGDLVNLHFVRKPDRTEPDDVMVKKCLGYSQFGTNSSLPGAKRGLGLFGFQPSVGTYGYLYGAWDDATPDVQIYSIRTAAADPTSCGASAKFATNDTDVEFEQVNDVLYAANGIDATIKMDSAGSWAGVAGTEPFGGSGTVAKYLSWHNFMLWAFCTVNAPNKLNVSDSGAPETFSGNTKTFPYKGVGIKPLGNYQVIYTERTIHTALGYTPSQLGFQEIKNPQPCVSHRSIVQMTLPESVGSFGSGSLVHVYLGADYVWAFNGSSFEPLDPDGWGSVLATLNTAKLNLAAATYDPTTQQYRLSVCTGANTRNNKAFAYDFTGGHWVELPGRSAAAYARLGAPIPSVYWQEATAVGLTAKENDGQNITIPSTTLNGAHTAVVATLTVASTTGFPSSGKVVVESETIRYTGTDATSFTGCIRGSDGTVAATHATGKAVYVAPQCKYSTVFLDEGDKNRKKKYKQGWLDAKASTTAYSLAVSQDVDQYGESVKKWVSLLATGATWGSFTWGDGTLWGAPATVQHPHTRFPLSGKGQEQKLIIEENANIQQTELYSLEYLYRPLTKK